MLTSAFPTNALSTCPTDAASGTFAVCHTHAGTNPVQTAPVQTYFKNSQRQPNAISGWHTYIKEE